jgi:voltage-gated potassium channel
MTEPDEIGCERERHDALAEFEARLENPMIVLAVVWLALLVVELVRGMNAVLDAIGLAIWAVFVVEFLLRLFLAPRRLVFLRTNLLTLASLVLPALRVLRIAPALRALRLARAARGARLLRIVASVNRGMKLLAGTLRRRGFGYVLALTLLITVIGAAGMFSFERGTAAGSGFTSYGEALWWTSMLLISLGSEYWPRTAEGRTLSLLLALYGFAVFGYLTAVLASFFIGRDADSAEAELAGKRDTEALRAEVRAIRDALEAGGRDDGGRRG